VFAAVVGTKHNLYSPHALDGSSDISDLCARFLAAQLRGDRREALRIVLEEGVERGLDVPALHLGVIAPAQRVIGELWQTNRIGFAEEHQATAIAHLALARLYPHLPRRRPIPCEAVVACVEGEQHDLGAKMVADFLETEGVTVHYLGATVPVPVLVEAVRQRRAQLVALSVTIGENLPAAEVAVAAVRAASPDTHIAVGGRGLDDDPTFVDRLAPLIVARDAGTFLAALRAAGLVPGGG
jgi:methanogenic corrinoid protein MtbC1